MVTEFIKLQCSVIRATFVYGSMDELSNNLTLVKLKLPVLVRGTIVCPLTSPDVLLISPLLHLALHALTSSAHLAH